MDQNLNHFMPRNKGEQAGVPLSLYRNVSNDLNLFHQILPVMGSPPPNTPCQDQALNIQTLGKHPN